MKDTTTLRQYTNFIKLQNFDTLDTKTGAVVEWLEQLNYGAESRRKVMISRLGFAMQ